MNTNFETLISQYKTDNQSVYNTWFINNEERLKAFRSIRRGVIQVVDDVKAKRFPNDFKGSDKYASRHCTSLSRTRTWELRINIAGELERKTPIQEKLIWDKQKIPTNFHTHTHTLPPTNT